MNSKPSQRKNRMSVLSDHVIVITGASEGIGRALRLVFAGQKPKLVLAARNQSRLNELKAKVESLGAQALVVPTDITDQDGCRHLIEATISKWNRLDVLVNNAGRTMWTTLEDMTDTGIIEQLMRINYLGAAYCTYYALSHLKKRKGRIVVVSSIAGLSGIPTRTAYAASKHALFGFFDSLRIELRDTGVTVSMIAPDFVLSEMHRRALGCDGKPLGKSPMQEGKIMTAEKCATLIVKAVENRDRLLVTSFRGKLGRWVKMLAPDLIDKVAAKAIKKKK
jgi:short-subunit dehydrogenase